MIRKRTLKMVAMIVREKENPHENHLKKNPFQTKAPRIPTILYPKRRKLAYAPPFGFYLTAISISLAM